MTDKLTITDALYSIGSKMKSDAEQDLNGYDANFVDGLFAIARALERIAFAINNMPDVSDDK